jgi:histidinol-phosphate aminotransferase
MTRDWLEPLLVPAARDLPSNADYLAHLDAVAADPSLIRLASNENTEPPSPLVREALARSYEDANWYPPRISALQLALARRFGVPPDRVLLGAGSTELIDATLRAFVRPGDEVLVPTPSCRTRLAALEGRIVDVPLRRDERSFEYDVGALVAAVGPLTKLIVVCSPNNPTGNSISIESLHECAQTGRPLLVDAAYADFDPDVDVSPLVHEYDGLILTRTFSKAYALAGLRLGYAIGDAEVLEHVGRFLLPGSSVSSPALHAGLAALDDEEHHRLTVVRIRSERDRLVAGLRERGLRAFDSRGNFVAVAPVEGARAFAARLLERGILVRAMDEQLARITVGTAAENDAVLSALDKEERCHPG